MTTHTHTHSHERTSELAHELNTRTHTHTDTKTLTNSRTNALTSTLAYEVSLAHSPVCLGRGCFPRMSLVGFWACSFFCFLFSFRSCAFFASCPGCGPCAGRNLESCGCDLAILRAVLSGSCGRTDRRVTTVRVCFSVFVVTGSSAVLLLASIRLSLCRRSIFRWRRLRSRL